MVYAVCFGCFAWDCTVLSVNFQHFNFQSFYTQYFDICIVVLVSQYFSSSVFTSLPVSRFFAATNRRSCSNITVLCLAKLVDLLIN